MNTIINDYIEDIFTLHYGARQRTSSWLVTQLRDMKQQVEADQATLVELQSKLDLLGLDPKSTDYLQAQSLDTFTKAAGEATIEKIVAEAKYRYLRESDPNLIEGGQQVLSSRTVPNSGSGNAHSITEKHASTIGRKLFSFACAIWPELSRGQADKSRA